VTVGHENLQYRTTKAKQADIRKARPTDQEPKRVGHRAKISADVDRIRNK
jgi:hypothetical protein